MALEPRAALFAALLVAILGAPAVCAGPLALRTPGPLRELFLDMVGFDARPLPAPELDVRWTASNTWNEPMTLRRGSDVARQELDEQADALTVRARAPWPFARRVWSALELRGTLHWGGWTDRPIEAFHSLIGGFGYHRDRYPRNATHLVYADSGGTAFDLSRPTPALGDAVLRTQASLVELPVALAARLDVKLPTGSLRRAAGSGGLDAGAGLAATWPALDGLTLHGLLALSWLSHLRSPVLLQPKRWHLTAELSVEWQLSENAALIGETRALSPLLEPGWRFATPQADDDDLLSSGAYADFRTHNQLSLGFRYGRLTTWFSEDYTPGSNPHSALPGVYVSNAPDLVLGVSWTQPL